MSERATGGESDDVDVVGGAGHRPVSVRVGVLGPLSLAVDGVAVDVPGARRRAVLALLATSAGRTVPTDRLLDAVWPDEVPGSGRRALHSHVSRLRGHLGAAAPRLERDEAGYRLDLAPTELDAARAETLAADAATAPPARAAMSLGEALGLWRGPALAEFTAVAPLAARAVALGELHDRITDDWIEARLRAAAGGEGRGPDEGAGRPDPALVADAGRVAAEAPLRERAHALSVRALAAAGRQAEALRAAHAFRRRLADETGLAPTASFDALEQEVALGVLAPAAPVPGTMAVMTAAGVGSLAETRARRPVVARPTAPLVGRAHEEAELHRHLASHRLTTVVGPGGVGKTRLALEVVAAASVAGTDVVVVELAMVEEPAQVVDAVAEAVGVRERTGADAVDACADALAGRPTTLLSTTASTSSTPPATWSLACSPAPRR